MTRLSVTFIICAISLTAQAESKPPLLVEIKVKSSIDGTMQPSRLWAPPSAHQKATPLFVFLHSWSGDYRQDNAKWHREAVKRGWIFLHPNFRGRNDHPEACGSKLARQDIIDAMNAVKKSHKVDASRIYLAGTSGGGHMAMLMAGHFPNEFTAVSAWVGISNLAEWYTFHVKDGKPQRYAKMILASLGGPPSKSDTIEEQFRDRSPSFHLRHVGSLPIDINAGVNDGHTGSVPISHSLKAFNAIAKAHGNKIISKQEMDELWKTRKLSKPTKLDQTQDKTYGRAIILRRESNAARVTIFDGGHEGLPNPACEWLAKQVKLSK